MENMGTATGLLELYHIPDHQGGYRNGNENGGEGFGHVGFSVPDVGDVLKRASEMGYRVIKPLGEAKLEQFGVPSSVKSEDVVEGYKFVFRQLAFIVDPDVSDLCVLSDWRRTGLMIDRVIGLKSYLMLLYRPLVKKWLCGYEARIIFPIFLFPSQQSSS